MSSGLEETLINTGSGDRVIVMREGTNFEGGSFIPLNELELIRTTPGIAQDFEGNIEASIEMVNSVNLTRRDDPSEVNIPIRGLDIERLHIRPDIEIKAGRWMKSGLHELVVGEVTRRQFQGVEIGDKVSIRNDEWEVVGTFTSGDALESGFLADGKTLMAAYDRTSANSVRLVLESGVTVEEFQASLTENTTLLLTAISEREYYERTAGRVTQLLSIVSNAVAGIMALGALFGALNTMYSAVSTRSSEIATLRALGFGRACVVISVLTESMLLSLTGAALGALLAWLFFSGDLVSISSLSFQLSLGADLVVTGIIWACAIGLIGGLFPAIRAARMPIVVALREM
jgi:putative ABC transport system permease protein